MTLAIADAEATLRARLGEPAKPPTDYVIGFRTPSGKVLAVHREASEMRRWFRAPEPPGIGGQPHGQPVEQQSQYQRPARGESLTGLLGDN